MEPSEAGLEARVGFEPTNGGFADLSLRPLGYRAVFLSIASSVRVRYAGKYGCAFTAQRSRAPGCLSARYSLNSRRAGQLLLDDTNAVLTPDEPAVKSSSLKHCNGLAGLNHELRSVEVADQVQQTISIHVFVAALESSALPD